MTLSRVLAAAFIAVLPTACISVSTYPPTPGAQVVRPSVSPGPEVMASAIKEAHRTTQGANPIVFNLPAGLDASTWRRVADLLPRDSRAMRAGDANAYSIQQLRLSGAIAEVDVVYSERGVYQLMTVKLESAPMAGWRPQWCYRWVIPATAPVANDPMIAFDVARAEQAAAAKTEAEAEQTKTETAATEQAAAPTDGNGG